MSVVLRELEPQDEPAFLEALKSFPGESLHLITFEWKPEVEFADHIERLRKNRIGADLAPGMVPSSLLYGFVDGVIVGRVSIRHALNEYLARRGGHIGYSVGVAFRRRGYASEMFRQALSFCKELGLTQVMMTCADNNVASWKLLEKSGSVLTEIFVDENNGVSEKARRYWLDIP